MKREAIDLPPVTLSEEDGVRYLHLGSIWIQGGMRIRKPQVVEIDYVQRMLASLLWLPGETLGEGRAVQLGLGAGALTRFTAVALKMATTVVEINPQVVDVARTLFDNLARCGAACHTCHPSGLCPGRPPFRSGPLLGKFHG